jgi:hypothetical protein
MKITKFDRMLDRYGADFDAWPRQDASHARRLIETSAPARRSYAALRLLESQLRETRPEIDRARAERVVSRALAGIVQIDSRPAMLDRIWALLAAPLPRAAFALSLTAVGFSIGLAVGSPRADASGDTPAASLITASAADVLN